MIPAAAEQPIVDASSHALEAGTVVLLLAIEAGTIGVIAWWALRSLRRRAAGAERAAAESARNAEIASMTRGLAHEIKNPLSTVALNAQLLREEILDSPLSDGERAAMARRVDTLAREAARLRDILSDFLRYAGRMQLDRRHRDLREVATEIGDFFMPQAEQARVRFVQDSAADPVECDVDPALLKQAILNLLLNAVQAMEDLPEHRARTLRLAVSADPADGRAGRRRAIVEVDDTGPGIPPEQRSSAFEPYRTTKPGGNGLGLATARRIVEAHGGSIEALEAPGGGARFRISLPLAEAPGISPASPGA